MPSRPFIPWSIVVVSLLSTAVALAEPYYTDRDGNPLSAERTICGDNKMVKMTDEDSAMQKMGLPIGIYKANAGDGATAWCTGTLIANDLFITARHCAASCEDVTVTFGYLARNRAMETFRCKEIAEKGAGEDDPSTDYLILRLDGSPGVGWGYYKMADKTLVKDQPLLIIHHPMASPMKVSQKGCVYVGESMGLLQHRCDTQSGSSGSAILLPDFTHPENTRIVGIHTLGGCTADPSSVNAGPSIHRIAAVSPLVKSMLAPTAP